MEPRQPTYGSLLIELPVRDLILLANVRSLIAERTSGHDLLFAPATVTALANAPA